VKAAADDRGPAALDETLHAEKRPAGSAAMAVALDTDCRNSRRDRRNVRTSFNNETAAARDPLFARDSVTFYRDKG